MGRLGTGSIENKKNQVAEEGRELGYLNPSSYLPLSVALGQPQPAEGLLVMEVII